MSIMAEKASQLDREDPLAFTRNEFRIPTTAEIASTRLADQPLGVQPFRATTSEVTGLD